MALHSQTPVLVVYNVDSMIWTYVFAFILAFLVSIYGTPVARGAALRFGVVDKPDGNLKNHSEAVPYFGGLVVYVAVLIPLCLFYDFDRSILAILLAGTLVLLLGLIDDFGALTPLAKFIGQFIAAVVLIKGNIVIHAEWFHPNVNLALTLIWLIGMANAMNIIDIMDGLAAGTALIASIFLFVVAILNQHSMIAIFTITLVGSLIGFIRYNFHPARIYLGDTGSMFLGLTLGALAIIGDFSDRNSLAFFNPLLLLGVAIFDTVYVMALRAVKRRSVFLGSRDHFAVRLRIAGWSIPKIVLSTYLAGTILGGLAILNMYLTFRTSIALYACVLASFLVLGVLLTRIRVS